MTSKLILKVKKNNPDAIIPTKANITDSGWDLTIIKIFEKNNQVFLGDTGLNIEPPAGFYTQIVPRSSIYKSGFIQANSIGIIDSDYRGNLMVALKFLGEPHLALNQAKSLIGKRIAQLLLVPLPDFEIKEVKELSSTIRGEGGFGSSGS